MLRKLAIGALVASSALVSSFFCSNVHADAVQSTSASPSSLQSAFFVSGEDTSYLSSDVNKNMLQTWSKDFGADAKSLKFSKLRIQNLSFTGATEGTLAFTGYMQVNGSTYSLESLDNGGWYTQYQTTDGVVYKATVLCNVSSKQATLHGTMLLLYKPSTQQYEITMTIDDPVAPIYIGFGEKFVSSNVMNQMNTISPSQMENSVTTSTQATPQTTGSPWYEVAHGSTNVVNGYSLPSGVAAVVLASDQLQGSSNVIRDQVWGGQAAINYLENQFGSTAVSVTAVHFAVNTEQNFQLTGAVYPPQSSNSSLAAWTWTLGYVPWLGTGFAAVANQDLSYSDIGPDTSNGLYFAQWHLSLPSENLLASSANIGQNQNSYSEQFGTTSIGGESVQVDGLVVYFVSNPADGDFFDVSSNWIYADGSM